MTRPERDGPDALSVQEMLRIMDVATTLRQDRELAEEQLNVGPLKERLKERMLAASKVTGEDVTPEEVDLAIRQYYANLHTFHEPKMSFALAMAHAWVRRGQLFWRGLIMMALIALIWVIFFMPVSDGSAHRAASLAKEISRQAGVVRSLARDPKVAPEVVRLLAEADAYRKVWDPKGLATVRESLNDLQSKLGEVYSVIAVPQDTSLGRNRSTVVSYAPDSDKKVKAYYLFVQARGYDGKPIPRRIRSTQIGSEKVVTTWAEQIPLAVYDRLAKDKSEDGVLNETAFAVKRRGMLEEEVTMPGADGKTPFARMGRITGW